MTIPRYSDKARRVIEATLNTTAAVYRKTQVADSSGGFTDTYTKVTTYPCSFTRSGITPLERENAFTTRTIVLWQFTFPQGSDVRSTDRLVSGGRTFEVVSGAEGSFQLATRVLAQEIT